MFSRIIKKTGIVALALLAVLLAGANMAGAATYNASGTYIWDSETGVLTLNWTSSDFACSGPELGTETQNNVTITATMMTWPNAEMTWERDSGTADDIVGTWTSTEIDTGNSYTVTVLGDGTFSLTGEIFQCDDEDENPKAEAQHDSINGYQVFLRYNDSSGMATSVNVTGPGITDSVSLTLNPNDLSGQTWGSGTTESIINLGATYPAGLPYTYTFTITDSSPASPWTATSTVSCFQQQFVSGISPSGTITEPPTFSWTGIDDASAVYGVQVNDSSGNWLWGKYHISGTSIAYDGPALMPGETYDYVVSVQSSSACNDPTSGGGSYVTGSFTYAPTVPLFTLNLMQTEITAIKGQVVEIPVKIGFYNDFTTTGGISLSVPELSSGVSVIPASTTRPGGMVVRIDTAGLNPGYYNLTVRSSEAQSDPQTASFELRVVTVSDIKFYEYDDNYQKGDYITSKTVAFQGQFGGSSTGVNYEVHTSDGEVMENALSGVTVTSINTAIVGAYLRYWGYDLWALANGTTNLRATAPDGTVRDLPVTVEIPSGAPRIVSISVSPSYVSNNRTEQITFYASGDTDNYISGIGADMSGYMNLGFDLGNPDYEDNYVTNAFVLDNPPTDIGTIILDASASRSGYSGSSTAAVPLTTYNDPSFAGLDFAFKSLD